jgi:hypothetical protein
MQARSRSWLAAIAVALSVSACNTGPHRDARSFDAGYKQGGPPLKWGGFQSRLFRSGLGCRPPVQQCVDVCGPSMTSVSTYGTRRPSAPPQSARTAHSWTTTDGTGTNSRSPERTSNPTTTQPLPVKRPGRFFWRPACRPASVSPRPQIFFGGSPGREIILSCRRLVGAVWLAYCLVAEGGKEAEVKLAEASAAIARLVRS